jgi:hypothetical protein
MMFSERLPEAPSLLASVSHQSAPSFVDVDWGTAAPPGGGFGDGLRGGVPPMAQSNSEPTSDVEPDDELEEVEEDRREGG